MRFVAVSDTHMAEVELPEGDVFINACMMNELHDPECVADISRKS